MTISIRQLHFRVPELCLYTGFFRTTSTKFPNNQTVMKKVLVAVAYCWSFQNGVELEPHEELMDLMGPNKYIRLVCADDFLVCDRIT